MRNERAAGDSRHARTGKDGAFYSEDGVLLATVEQFTSNVNWNNAKYSVLGDAYYYALSTVNNDCSLGGLFTKKFQLRLITSPTATF